MSRHAVATDQPTHSDPSAASAQATPEFDRREIDMFGKDDGHAVGVIGKMLVGFFFYSLLVMIAVAWWTRENFGQKTPPAAHAQAEEAEE